MEFSALHTSNALPLPRPRLLGAALLGCKRGVFDLEHGEPAEVLHVLLREGEHRVPSEPVGRAGHKEPAVPAVAL
ncbi:MAG: hypothetical protein ACK559_25115, partial [bacterium]